MGAVFALFAAFYYWFPKITGRAYSEVLGHIHFWLLSIGVNLTFMPMHFLGLSGMPRRIPDYPDAFAGWNAVSSFGSIISIVATLLFLYIIYEGLSLKVTTFNHAPNNYWAVPPFFSSPRGSGPTPTESAHSLEWTLSSPPSFHHVNHLPLLPL
jgi:cytochrome c oxidase subunit 1